MYFGPVAALIYPVALWSFHVSVVSAYETGGGRLQFSLLRPSTYLVIRLASSDHAYSGVGGQADRPYRQPRDARKCKPEIKGRHATFVA